MNNMKYKIVLKGIYEVCWPLPLQAARVTDACDKLKQTGPEIRARPWQYTNTPQLDLDSYIQLTQAVRMRVRNGRHVLVW